MTNKNSLSERSTENAHSHEFAQSWTVQDRPFRFSLFQLFLLTTAGSLLFGLGQLIGNFSTSLILGLLIIYVVISQLGIENLLVGAMAGLAMSIAILIGTTALCAWHGTSNIGASLFCAALAYPMAGYTLGLLSTGYSTWRYD